MNYAISVSSANVTLTYTPSSDPPRGVSTSTTVDGLSLSHDYWHHVAVTVFDRDAIFYINGSIVGVMSLEGPIVDDPTRDIRLGQLSTS